MARLLLRAKWRCVGGRVVGWLRHEPSQERATVRRGCQLDEKRVELTSPSDCSKSYGTTRDEATPPSLVWKDGSPSASRTACLRLRGRSGAGLRGAGVSDLLCRL